MHRKRPLVGVISDRRLIEPHPIQMVGEKYVQALVDAAEVYPVALPSLASGLDVIEILDRLDGVFLPGSPSNMEPLHYAGSPSKPGTWHDPERDQAALAMITEVVRIGVPLFAVCRGFQEMNVAFGGTLHQLVHEIPGYGMHKEDPADPIELQYAPRHAVSFVAGGQLARITGQSAASVNSLHSQAIDRLGDGLVIEARADDGLIEAISVDGAPGFALGVQWHPEWQVADSATSMAIFGAFGDACRIRQTGPVS